MQSSAIRIFQLFFVAGVVWLGTSPAAADDRVTCRSKDFKYNHCGVNERGPARIVRQLSDSPCVQGRTWGRDRGGIWVDEGCAAEFIVGRGDGRERDRDDDWRGGRDRDEDRRGRGNRNVRACKSEGFKRKHCRMDTQGTVRLSRQLSDAPCVRGRTWGEDHWGVWVDDGCAAEFIVGGRRGNAPPRGPWW